MRIFGDRMMQWFAANKAYSGSAGLKTLNTKGSLLGEITAGAGTLIWNKEPYQAKLVSPFSEEVSVW